MDKIITINLGGYAIKIEEDAYEALKPYIQLIEKTFANNKNGKEIINDIEARLAEMLMERTEGKISASLVDVEFVKEAMGNPGEFDDNEVEENPSPTPSSSDSVRKRLYRDTENKVFGGVCSGISNYFDMDATIIRLIWIGLVFFFGTGILLYFILWLIVPEATTTAQKLEMKGEAPTLDNIINRVKSEAGRVEENIKAQNFGKKIEEIFGGLGSVFKIILKLFTFFVGLLLLFILSGILISLISGGATFISHHDSMAFHSIPNFFNSGWEFLTVKILVGLFLCIPLFVILIGAVKFVFNAKVNFKPLRIILAWLWVLTIPVLIYFIYQGLQNFRSRETITNVKIEKLNAPILINTNYGENDVLWESPEVRIAVSNDDSVHITTTQTAYGINSKQATEMALAIGASYHVSNQEITLEISDPSQKSELFRGQKVKYLIEIPNGKSFSINPSFNKINYAQVTVVGQNVTYYMDEESETKHNLLFYKNALYCPTCSDSLPPGCSGLNDFSNFNKINASGLVDIEIIPGNTYLVQKSGPASMLQDLEIWQSGHTLEIDYNEDNINLKTRPKVIITMPELKGLTLRGASNCKSGHFGGEEFKVQLTGVSMADLDVEFSQIEIQLAGVSHVELKGNTHSIHYEIAGKSSVNAEKLNMEKASLQLVGVSEAILGPAKTISGEISGASKLEYIGNPNLQVKTHGLGKVMALNK